MGCISESSVVVGTNQIKKQTCSELTEDVSRRQGKENPSRVKIRNSWGFLSFPKFDFSGGMQRLMKRVKSFSQLFVYKEEEEVMEKEIEIGYPTDVKHVTHIGWDGSTTINPIKGWENLKPPQQLFSSPQISLEQFELAMAAQADDPKLTQIN